MKKQTLVSSFDDMAFGADLAARRPFGSWRRIWNAIFRGSSGTKRPPLRETRTAVRETKSAVPESRPAAPVPGPAVPEITQSSAVLDEPRQSGAADHPAPAATHRRPPAGSEPRMPRVSDATRELRRQCESIIHSLRQSHSGSEAGPRLIGLTSCYAGEGVTTLATHLALAAANDHRVLLADLNFDAPAIHKMFRAQLDPGLAECLGDGRDWEEILQPVPGTNVTLATAGVARAGHAAAVERLRDLVRFAADRFDFAIFDLSPLNRPTDTFSLCELLDGVLLLIESERVRWPVAKRFVTGLERSGAKTLGAVMNKRREHIPGWLYRAL